MGAGGPHFFPRQHAAKPCLHSPYSTAGPYAHTDLHVGALLPVLLKARRGFEAEGPKMLQLLAADEWTLDFMASRPQDYACADFDSVVGRLTTGLAEGTRSAELAHLWQQDDSLTLDEQLAALCVRIRLSLHSRAPPWTAHRAHCAQLGVSHSEEAASWAAKGLEDALIHAERLPLPRIRSE